VIDVHCHVLPGLDDGAEDWDVSLAMVRIAMGEGVTQCVATPHWTGAPGEADRVRSTLEELRQRLQAAGIAFKVHPGNEVILVPRLVEDLREGRALPLGDSNYVLLETAQLEYSAYTHQALFHLQSSGYRVVLAHPERVRAWHGQLGEVRELLQRGCFLQVNAQSLTGGFGSDVRKQAELFLRLGWAALLATDAHSDSSRPPLLRAPLERCAELIGDDAALALVEQNPYRVLCGEQLPYADADRTPPRRFPWLWWPRRL